MPTTLSTDRLTLRTYADADADALFDLHSRVEVQRWLGDLKLREAQTLIVSTNTPAARTNLVLAAVTNLNRVVLTYTNSPFRPEAIYLRGWCRWELDQPADAAMDFALAAQRLPRSEEQAIARFKLAEAQARLVG